MALTDTQVFNMILDKVRIPTVDTNITFEGVIVTPSGRIPIDKILSVEIERDYEQNYCDDIFIQIALGPGTLNRFIYPYKDQLSVILTMKKVFSNSREIDTQSSSYTMTYPAHLVDTSAMALVASSDAGGDTLAANRSKLLTIEMQLIDPIPETFRLVEVQGIYKGTVSNVIKTLLTSDFHLSSDSPTPTVSLENYQRGAFDRVVGVEMESASNRRQYRHIVVEPGVKLVDLPTYLQARYGVYASGLGYYLQRGIWYIYPFVDTKRFDQKTRTITIANVDSSRMPGTEITHYKQGEALFVVATRNAQHIDVSESQQLNEGNGIRFINNHLMVDNYTKTSKNITHVTRADNVSEFVVEQRNNGLNATRFAKRGTDNLCRQVSALNRRTKSTFVVNWENSNPALVLPDMPVKILYDDGSRVQTLYGTLAKAAHAYNLAKGGVMETKYYCNSLLTIIIDRVDHTQTA